VPHGASSGEGCYLHYPFEDLLRLLVLESHRHRVLVVAEDLGTVARGFRARIGKAGLLGMRVLWFQKTKSGTFCPPEQWETNAVALSTTHDLPTLAGWWEERDIRWHRRLGWPGTVEEKKQRRRDKRDLWRMFRQAGTGKGALPERTSIFADAAVGAIAQTPCLLKLLPVEDFVGEAEQPNIPGTIDQHPNWRRRLRSATPLASPSARRRSAILRKDAP